MTPRERWRYSVVIAGAAILSASGGLRAMPSPPSPDFRATSVTLTGLASDRISSAMRADNGDVVLGVIGSRGGGSIVRVTKRKRVTSFRTTEPVASVAVAGERTCWVPFVRPVVHCISDGARDRNFPIPGMQPASQLLRSRSVLFAVDATNGQIFTVGASSVDLSADITAGASVASDAYGLVFVTQKTRCSLPLASKRPQCLPLRPPLDEALILAAFDRTLVVSDYPASSVTIVTPSGQTAHRQLPSVPSSVIARNRESVWVGGRNSAGYLVLYAISSSDVHQFKLPSALQGYVGADSILLEGKVGDDLAIVDNHQRLVTFLTATASLEHPGDVSPR